MRDPWGVDQPPETTAVPPLPPGLAAHAEVARTGTPLRIDDGYVEPENLPEVQALIEQGWSALSDAPVNYLVPAAWPARHRCWVRDRTPTAHHQGSSTSDYYGWITPIDSFEPAPWSLSQEIAADAEKAGLPEPPPDRRWLVRSPWPGIEVDDVLWLMTRRGEAPLMTGEPFDGPLDFLTPLRELLAMSQDEIAQAIRVELDLDPLRFVGLDKVGRELAEHEVDPDEFEQWRVALGLSAEALLAWMGSAQLVDAGIVGFVRSWRGAGLPGDPPRDAERFVGRDLGEVRGYLDAGFTLYDADRLELVGLARAVAWRDAGFSESDTYELLRADPDLHIEEARAFDRDELREYRRDWIYWGFSADEALAWSATGLSAGGARLWRAGGHAPQEAPPQNPDEILVSVPPGLQPNGASFGWFAYAPREGRQGSMVAAGYDVWMNEWESVQDPPGTRGRGPRRRRGDPHPWIQTD
ncbi:MAG: hypothetical protein ABI384_09000 [Allobranchiibius sp.]